MTARSDGVDTVARSKILVAARALFTTRGYPDTSMGMIAKEAGVVRATVYNNFADKEAILGALMAEYMDGYVAIPRKLKQVFNGEYTSFEMVEAIIRAAFTWRLENAELRPLIDISTHLGLREWVDSNNQADAAIRRSILGILRADAEKGLLRDDVNLTFSTAALYGMIEATLSTFDVKAPAHKVDRAIKQLALLHWYAIYSIEPPERSKSGLSAQL
jgi:AcrR family transcriptional regulator